MTTTTRRQRSTSPLSAAGGNYYATASERRDDGRRFGTQVARQRRTLRQAQVALEAAIAAGPADRGYVQVWVEAEQQRHVVAELDEAGNWWARNPYTGNLEALAGPECRTRLVAGRGFECSTHDQAWTFEGGHAGCPVTR